MSSTSMSTKKEQSNGSSSTENKKGIENHKTAAKHHEEAAKHHRDAAKHHEAGNHSKASESTVKAHGERCLACDAEREDVKHHALNN
jgi:hypothetical protein